MDFFNKVGSSLSSLANGASAKTKNMMDLSALNNQLRQHEDTLKGLYEAIGRQYYAETKSNAGDAYKENFGQIAAVEAAADELRKKIEINKSMVTCPKCGGLTENTSRFCKNCGNPMQNVAAQQPMPAQQPAAQAAQQAPARQDPVPQTPVQPIPTASPAGQTAAAPVTTPPVMASSGVFPPIAPPVSAAEAKTDADNGKEEKENASGAGEAES